MNISISDQKYQALLQSAQARHVTPEALIEQLIDHLPAGFADNEDDFYRPLGQSDEQIAQIKAESKLLPDTPNW